MAGELQAGADIMKILFGEKALGDPAQFTPLGGNTPLLGGNQGVPQNFGQQQPNPLEGFMQQLASQGRPPQLPIGQATTQDEIGGNADILNGLGQVGPPASLAGSGLQQEQMGPPEELAGSAGPQGAFGKFFGNMDQNLQSPSKVIGMGLLGQMNPALGYGGLLASGLFGENKLFGK